jgi:hypothetical protein
MRRAIVERLPPAAVIDAHLIRFFLPQRKERQRKGTQARQRDNAATMSAGALREMRVRCAKIARNVSACGVTGPMLRDTCRGCLTCRAARRAAPCGAFARYARSSEAPRRGAGAPRVRGAKRAFDSFSMPRRRFFRRRRLLPIFAID